MADRWLRARTYTARVPGWGALSGAPQAQLATEYSAGGRQLRWPVTWLHDAPRPKCSRATWIPGDVMRYVHLDKGDLYRDFDLRSPF